MGGVFASAGQQFFWALVGALLGLALKPAWDYAVSRRGEFTGEWTQVIPAFGAEPEKLATVKVQHVGDRLYGITERTSPKQAYRQRWKVEARVKRGLIFGIYWPEDSSRLPGSYGTLQFKIRHENAFDGFYVRAQAENGTTTHEWRESLNTIPLRWERDPEAPLRRRSTRRRRSVP